MTQRIDRIEGYDEVREALDIKWCELLQLCGYFPLLVSSKMDVVNLMTHIDVQGIVLTGGNDLTIVNDNPMNQLRDTFERDLIQRGIEKNIPILGVCRGMQMIAAYCGESIEKVTGHVAVQHAIRIKEDSVVYRATKTDIEEVNSFHGYCVALGKESQFEVLAQTEDETIEAIVHKKHKLTGIMWHPERVNPFKESDITLIQSILQ